MFRSIQEMQASLSDHVSLVLMMERDVEVTEESYYVWSVVDSTKDSMNQRKN